jgi:DnaJ-class molecular chaperone
MNNFPLGASTDVLAPYNQIDVTCPLCEGTGLDPEPIEHDTEPCKLCEGSGTVLKQVAAEYIY